MLCDEPPPPSTVSWPSKFSKNCQVKGRFTMFQPSGWPAGLREQDLGHATILGGSTSIQEESGSDGETAKLCADSVAGESIGARSPARRRSTTAAAR